MSDEVLAKIFRRYKVFETDPEKYPALAQAVQKKACEEIRKYLGSLNFDELRQLQGVEDE